MKLKDSLKDGTKYGIERSVGYCQNLGNLSENESTKSHKGRYAQYISINYRENWTEHNIVL